MSALRFWSAFLILLPLLLAVEKRLPQLRPRDLGFTALLALFGLVFYNLFFLGALELIPAGRTALVVALNPILTAVAMAVAFGERLPRYRWLGIVTALVGVWIVLARGDPIHLLQRVGQGELLMLGGAACWAIYTVVGRLALGERAWRAVEIKRHAEGCSQPHQNAHHQAREQGIHAPGLRRRSTASGVAAGLAGHHIFSGALRPRRSAHRALSHHVRG